MADAGNKCPFSSTISSSQNINNDQQCNSHEISSNNSLVFPFDRSVPDEPPIEYNQLRNEKPIYRATLINGNQVWLISRYSDVCLVLGDDEHFSKVQNNKNMINSEFKHGLFSNMDSGKYLMYRQIIGKEFSIDRVKGYELKMKIIVDNLLTELINQNSPIDFVSEFARKVPSFILYDLLGINKMDYEFLNNRNSNNLNENQTSRKELSDYIHRLIINKKQTVGTDIISRLITEQLQPGKINQDELINIISLLFRQDGNETIQNLICLGVISLLKNNEQFDRLRKDISLIDNTVEETLRYYTGLSFITHRMTIKDIEINGQIIKIGEDIFALNASANRDEQVFTNPDSFDISRPPQHHLSFGYGLHQCIAMHLVRTQLQIVFNSICEQLPNLRLDQSNKDNIQFITDSNKDIGVQRMMVKW